MIADATVPPGVDVVMAVGADPGSLGVVPRGWTGRFELRSASLRTGWTGIVLCWQSSHFFDGTVPPSPPSTSPAEPTTTPMLRLLGRHGQLQSVNIWGVPGRALESRWRRACGRYHTDGLTTKNPVSGRPRRRSTPCEGKHRMSGWGSRCLHGDDAHG
jgi:hypothetical protein